MAKCNSQCLTRLCFISVLPPLFLIYINDLSDEIVLSSKIFADDTTFFLKIENKSCSNFQLNKDFETVNEHVNNKLNKRNKSIDIMKKLSLTLSRKSLLIIYKTFIRPILDYANMIHHKPVTESLKINYKWSNIMQLLLLLVQLKVHCLIAFTESSVQNPLLNRDGPVSFFSSTI